MCQPGGLLLPYMGRPRTLLTAATKPGRRRPAATTAPPTGTMKFLSVLCTTASTRPRRHAAVTCSACLWPVHIKTPTWHIKWRPGML